MERIVATLLVEPSAPTQPLLDGEVTAKGMTLYVEAATSIDDNCRRMAKLELDLAEVSIGTYVKARDQGLPVIGLPLFTSGRQFLHAGVQLAARSRIRDLSDLRGRAVSTGQYWQGPPIWQRHLFKEMYGIDAEDVSWVTYRPERMEGLGVPAGVRHRLDSSGRSAAELAEGGEIDAHLTRGVGAPRPGAPGDRPPSFVPAFPDWAAAEREYYLRTGVFPILHLTVMREDLANDHPEVVESICDAFSRAKTLAQTREQSGPSETHSSEIDDETRELVGGDAWPFGITPNRKALEAFVATAHDQGLVGRRYRVEELFASTLPEDML